MTNYLPYQYKGKIMLIDRYLILAEEYYLPDKYDIFDQNINKIADMEIEKIQQNGYGNSRCFDDVNREMFNCFKYYKEFLNKKIFLYTEVYSKTKTKVIVNITCSKNGKLWVNGKCLSIHSHYGGQFYLSLYLKKGLNIFLVEVYSPEDTFILTIQLRNYTFEMGNDFKALSNCKHLVTIDPLILIHDNIYQVTGKKFRFMYMLNDTSKYKADYRIDIHDSSTGFVKTHAARINEVVEIELNELRKLHVETLRHEWIGCVYKDNSGSLVIADVSENFNCTKGFIPICTNLIQ